MPGWSDKRTSGRMASSERDARKGGDPRPPFVSIIVPAFNAEGTISDCLHALVEQEYPRDRYEILAVDNNSQDRTAEIIRKFPVTYVSETKQQSSYAARNRGIAKASGEILAFTDADCIADRMWASHAVERFRDDTVGCVAGHIGNTPPDTVVQEYLLDVLAQTDFLSHPFLPYAVTANVFYRKAVIERIGPFDGTWVSGGDADLAWRMQLQTPYRLVYCEDATIQHMHRRTHRAHFRQRWTWGYGAVLLYERYRLAFQSKGLGYDVKALASDYRQLLKMSWRCGIAWWKWRRRSISRKDWDFTVLDWLSELGTRVGRIHGSVQRRIFYL